MQSPFRTFLPRLFCFLFLYLAIGCHSSSHEVSADYNIYKFDTQVIEKLPVYDSLVSAILGNFASFKKLINENDSYRAYKYMPLSNEADVLTKIPQDADSRIARYYDKLGKNFIYGFDVFRDSTIKIYIRTIPSKRSQIDIEENLSYYPAGNKIQRRQFPVKDTILNKHWQYWTIFNKGSLF